MLKKNEKHTKFILTDELISKILDFINSSDDNSILETFSNYHHADIAEIIEELNSEEATYIIKLLDSEKTSDVLMELDDDYREKILKNLSRTISALFYLNLKIMVGILSFSFFFPINFE